MNKLSRRGLCLVLSAPSGAGKSSVSRALLEREPELRLSVSATTRAPRPGEQEGVHYFFRDYAEFQRMIAANELLEHAEVFGRSGFGPADVDALIDVLGRFRAEAGDFQADGPEAGARATAEHTSS